MRLALHDAMQADENVVLMGLGVADAKGVFGTTIGLQEKFGKQRVFDIPLSENSVTGVALGMAMMGLRPVFTHQRADFTFTSAEQLINQVAKTIYTTAGQYEVPLTIRMIVGRGWGQGPTHAQAPHGLYAGIPGLKVIAPSNPQDMYSMMRGAIEDPNPVIIIEHRWLHELTTPEDLTPGVDHTYRAHVVRTGSDLTLTGISYGFIEAAKITSILDTFGIQAELIDVRSVSPIDTETICASVARTKQFALVDISAPNYGFGAELGRLVSESSWKMLKASPLLLGPKFAPVPSSPQIALHHYPTLEDLVVSINQHFDLGIDDKKTRSVCSQMFPPRSPLRDQPDLGQVGPF